MIKSEYLEDDIVPDLILDLENEKIDRITEDSKSNMAILKHSIEVEKNFNDINNTVEKKFNDINNKIESIEDATKIEIQNSVFYLSKQIDDINNKLNKSDFVVYNNKISDEVTKIEDTFNKDDLEFIKNKEKINDLEKEVKDYNNKIIIEQKKLEQNIEVESELRNDMIMNNKKDLIDIIKVIENEVFKNKENIKLYQMNLDSKKEELNSLKVSDEENERKKHLIDLSNLVIEFNEIDSTYLDLKNTYDKTQININERINFNNNLIRSFNNIELPQENFLEFEEIKDNFNSIIGEFDLEKLFSKKTFEDINKLSSEAKELDVNNFNDINELIINKNKILKYKENFENFLVKSKKYSQNNEKIYSELLNITFELESLFENSIKQIKNQKNLENKIKSSVDKKIEAKNNESINLMKELKNEVLNLISNQNETIVETTTQQIEPLKLESKVLKNIKVSEKSNTFPVLVINSSRIVDTIEKISFSEIDEISDSRLLELYPNNDKLIDENLTYNQEVQNVIINDYKNDRMLNSEVVGKIIRNDFFYKNVKILGDGLVNVSLFDKENNNKSVKTKINKMFNFDEIEVINKEEAKDIISNIYGVENFNLEFCYYCNKDANFIIPSYQIKFDSDNHVNSYFPANLKYLPILKLKEILISNVQGKVDNLKEILDPDNQRNQLFEDKFLVFNLDLIDLSFTGDNIDVYSIFRVENNVKENNSVKLYIPYILPKNKFNNLHKTEIIITCKNKFGFSNCVKMFVDLSKYSLMFKLEKSISHGGNRHNFAINNFDTITGSQLFDEFRQEMVSSGVKEEYCNLSPNFINGNADFVLNIGGGDKIVDLIDNLDDVEHFVMLGKSYFNSKNIMEIFNKKVHLISGFQKNINLNNFLNDFYKKSYKDGNTIVNSWLISSIINNSSDKIPFTIGPLISKSGSKYNSISSSEDNLYRAFVKDTVWGKDPGPGLDLGNTKVEGHWKLFIE